MKEEENQEEQKQSERMQKEIMISNKQVDLQMQLLCG